MINTYLGTYSLTYAKLRFRVNDIKALREIEKLGKIKIVEMNKANPKRGIAKGELRIKLIRY